MKFVTEFRKALPAAIAAALAETAVKAGLAAIGVVAWIAITALLRHH